MDNEYLMESSLVEVIDKEWARDSLPADDIAVNYFYSYYCNSFIS